MAKTRDLQQQEDSEMQERFLMQSMLVGIVQQLERIERVVEGHERSGALRRSLEGDRNHLTVEDNFAALQTKLMAFSQANLQYEKKFSNSSLSNIKEWVDRRPQVSRSPDMARALIWTLDACKGMYRPEVKSVRLSERTLQELGGRLAYANHRWHDEEDEFRRNPQAYLARQQLQMEPRCPLRPDFDFDQFREQLEATAQGSSSRTPARQSGQNPARDGGDSSQQRREIQKEALAAKTRSFRNQLEPVAQRKP